MQSCTIRVSSLLIVSISIWLLVSIDSVASVDLIKSICNKTRSPMECKTTLGEDPRSKTAGTPRELANILIDLAVENVTKCVELVETLTNTTTTRAAWKPALETCAKEFNYSVMEFWIGKDELKSDRDAARYDVLDATYRARRCDDAMKKYGVNLPQVTGCVENICFFGFTADDIISQIKH